MGTAKLFIDLLQVSSLLPKADKFLAKQYKLSRKQIYLLYLIHIGHTENIELLKDAKLNVYAKLLNISASTLTRNIEKLEARKLLERVKSPGQKQVTIKLLSLGQLYAIDIARTFDTHFETLSAEKRSYLPR